MMKQAVLRPRGRSRFVGGPLVALIIGLLFLLLFAAGYFAVLALAVGVFVAPALILGAAMIGHVQKVVRPHRSQPTDDDAIAVALVVEAQGECPLGQTLHVGDKFLFMDAETTPDLCPLPCSRLASWLRIAASRHSDMPTTLVCHDGGHRVVFSLQLLQKTPTPTTPQGEELQTA